MPLSVRRSWAQRRFKEQLGQTNHFLITILIGLSAVESGQAERPQTFATSWEPEDRVRSAARSREFALKAGLAWTVDAIDTYLRLARRRPAILPIHLFARVDGAPSLVERLRIIAAASSQEHGPAPLLLVAGITWRNRLVHSLAESELPAQIRSELDSLDADIATRYQGLTIARITECLGPRSTGTRPPSFKEVAAFVRAAHDFVSVCDERFLESLDPAWYLREALAEYVAADPRSRFSNVWGKGPDRAFATIGQIAQQFGMTSADTDPSSRCISRQDLEAMAHWTPTEASRELRVLLE